MYRLAIFISSAKCVHKHVRFHEKGFPQYQQSKWAPDLFMGCSVANSIATLKEKQITPCLASSLCYRQSCPRQPRQDWNPKRKGSSASFVMEEADTPIANSSEVSNAQVLSAETIPGFEDPILAPPVEPEPIMNAPHAPDEPDLATLERDLDDAFNRQCQERTQPPLNWAVSTQESAGRAVRIQVNVLRSTRCIHLFSAPQKTKHIYIYSIVRFLHTCFAKVTVLANQK